MELSDRLRCLVEDLFSNDNIGNPNHPDGDERLFDALSYFRADPRRFTRILTAKITDEKIAACCILSKLFVEQDRKGNMVERDPDIFDETALLINLCESFVRYSADRFQTLLESVNNVLPPTTSGTSSAPQPSRKLRVDELPADVPRSSTELTASLMDDVAAIRKSLDKLSSQVLSLCAHVSRLENQSHARLELENKLKFCFPHWGRLSLTHQKNVSESILKELECRIEYKVVQGFLKTAKKSLGEANPAVASFYADWRRLWEDQKERLAEQALVMTDSSIAIINEALSKFESATDVQSRRSGLPSRLVTNKSTAEQAEEEEHRKEKFSSELTRRVTSNFGYAGQDGQTRVGFYGSSQAILSTEEPDTSLAVSLTQVTRRPLSVSESRIRQHRIRDTISKALAKERLELDEHRRRTAHQQQLNAQNFVKIRPWTTQTKLVPVQTGLEVTKRSAGARATSVGVRSEPIPRIQSDSHLPPGQVSPNVALLGVGFVPPLQSLVHTSEDQK